MRIRSRGSNLELRSAEWGNSQPPTWAQISGPPPISGVQLTNDTAFGFPAAAAAINLIQNNVAAIPFLVYRGNDLEKVIAADSWQYKLIHENPCLNTTPYDFMSDIAACVEGYGNAFVKKVKKGKVVVELEVINPELVRINNVKGEKTFDVKNGNKLVKGLTVSDILHVRGPTFNGSMSGYSRVQLHRNALGNAVALSEWQGAVFANGASPSLSVEVPGSLTEVQLQEMFDIFQESHAGLRNAGKPVFLTNGATVKSIGMDFETAQWVEAYRLAVEDVARIFDVPAELLEPTAADRMATEELALHFLRFHLDSRLRRIEMAFASDPDLFLDTGLFPEFQRSALLVTNVEAQSNADLRSRQGGIETANEIRARRGLAPNPDGDVLLSIPVGAGASGNAPTQDEPKDDPKPTSGNPSE